MTKELFLFELTQQLNNLPKEERDRTREYYSEMIADRMEGGMDESEAVAALGDPESIARGVLQSWRELNASKPVPQQPRACALNSVSIEDPSGDITVESGAENGAYELQYENCSAEDYSLSEQDGTLVIRYIRQKPEKPFSFFNMLSNRRLTVRLAGSVEGLSVRTSSGDIDLDHLNIQALTLSSASGDITIENVRCADAALSTASGDAKLREFSAENLEIRTASGDIELESVSISGNAHLLTRSGDARLDRVESCALKFEGTSGDFECDDLRVQGAMEIATISGDVWLRDVQAESCAMRTVSGDLRTDNCDIANKFAASFTSGDCELKNVNAGSVQVKAISGDLHLENVQARSELSACGTSGDVDVESVSGSGILLSTRNGDIRGTLRDIPGGYDFRVKTSMGDAKAPETRGEHIVEASTSYGDISLEVE